MIGILKKMCRKKLKPRQMFLFNDILVYGSIVIRNKKYTRQHIIPLENVKIEDIDDIDGNLKFSFYSICLFTVYFIISI